MTVLPVSQPQLAGEALPAGAQRVLPLCQPRSSLCQPMPQRRCGDTAERAGFTHGIIAWFELEGALKIV